MITSVNTTVVFKNKVNLSSSKKKKAQPELFVELSAEEETIVNVLKEKGTVNIDDLCFVCQYPMSKVSSLLLNLEFSSVVRSLPGKMYCMN